MRKQYKGDAWVSASKAGRASYCPHYLELERKRTKVSTKAQAARIRGDQKHEELNRKAEDKRCYVASHLYGIDDSRTELLRAFRDQSLTTNLLGKMLIGVYYRLSPSLVTFARKHPRVDAVIRRAVDRIIKALDKGHYNG